MFSVWSNTVMLLGIIWESRRVVCSYMLPWVQSLVWTKDKYCDHDVEYMHITRDHHNIVVAVLTPSGCKLFAKDGNSCMTYKISYIYKENWVIERYQGYTKANVMISNVIYEVVNFLQMKSVLDTKSISQKKTSAVVFKLRSTGINIYPLVAPLQECEKEIFIIYKGKFIPQNVFHLLKHQCRY